MTLFAHLDDEADDLRRAGRNAYWQRSRHWCPECMGITTDPRSPCYVEPPEDTNPTTIPDAP